MTRRLWLVRRAALVAFGLVVGGPVVAQAVAPPRVSGAMVVALQQPAAAPGSPSADGFEPVSQLPATREQLPAAPLLVAAYAFVWLMLIGYVWSLWRRLSVVERELAGVARRVDGLQRR